MNNVTIIGAGLAGCEAALQLASNGYNVWLYDSKPKRLLEAYKLSTCGELVCNNSIGNTNKESPLGQLLFELKALGSKTISIAEKSRINDPAYLAVDKKSFSVNITQELLKNNVNLICNHVTEIPKDDKIIIATGPLTDSELMKSIEEKYGIATYHFSDASSPIVDIKSIDLENDNVLKISDDLYAISISLKHFQSFYDEIIKQSSNLQIKSYDRTIAYDKCQSIENLAIQGINKLLQQRFSYSYFNTPCILLRRENALENGFILVGCTTTLSHPSQLSVFSKIPNFARCKIIKYGRMHKNTFVDSPRLLNEFYQINGTNTFIVGQLSGIDGYAPAISSGLVAALRIIYGDRLKPLPKNTMIGALASYVSNNNVTDFQPMCASFSLMKKVKNHYSESSRVINDYISYLKDM